jgi:hypothetical protein
LYSFVHSFYRYLPALAFGFAAALTAQAQAPLLAVQTPVPTVPAATATTATVRGHVADPTGARIPGATIAITTAAGTPVATVTADAAGSYAVTGLAPGSYIVRTTYSGFASFQSPAIQLTAGQVKRIDISMAIQVEQQSVTVTDESPTVTVDAGSNASATILKDKDLDAFSDDPDELSNELEALAGPSAGPNGGQIYIDGFTGGQLPPKSAIREIRINQNPFSAEFDKLGYGRIEILTKPGTDKLHGQFFIQGNDKSFNTGNPFAKSIPAYDSYQFNGTLNGALSKWASFFISAEQRNISDAYVYTAQTAAYDSSTKSWYIPMIPNTNIIIPVTGGVFSPRVRTNIAPRIDLQLGQKNTLTLRYQFFRDNESGVLGSTAELPTQATGSTSIEHTIQLSDAEVINDRIVNETRFQYLRDTSSSTSVSNLALVGVPGYFTGGGALSQNGNDHTDHFELQNLTTMTVGAHAIKFGTRLRDNRDANSTGENFNGSFSFSSLADYVSALNGNGALPNKLNYTTGTPAARANVFDAALFFQDDWKANKNLTISGGVRWESQNHISDHNDWAPRVAFAYALDGHKDSKQAKTVLRGGYGIFYDRFTTGYLLPVERFGFGPDTQKQVSISDPTCFTSALLTNKFDPTTACGAPSTNTSIINQIAPSYHSPYIQQTGVSLERQLTKATTLTGTYLHSFGVHQLVVRDSNAYQSTGARPDTSLGIVDQYYPEAVFKQDQLIVNVNARLTPSFSILGFYNLTSANTDGGGGSNPSNSYNLSQDYGRASFASRNMVFLMANYQGPWAIHFNPFLIAQSGKPYNITTANDITGDNFFNNRPSLVADSFCGTSNTGAYAQTSFGCLDTEPASPGENYTPIPINLGNGPAAVAVNLRVSRAFGLGPKLASGNAGGPPQAGGGPGGGRGPGGGGPGGGLGIGGLGGGGGRGMGNMFGSTNTGHKYNLNFSAQALNLFNNIDYGTPIGTVIPTQNSSTEPYGPGDRFGQSTSLARGIFSSPTSSASRRIFLQATFSF